MPEIYTKDGPVWREYEAFDPDTAVLPEPATWWKRLPAVRHLRWVKHSIAMRRHYAAWASVGSLPVNAGFDERCLAAIWRGEL